MSAVFVDTAALIAMGNKHDALHQQAIAVHRQLCDLDSQFVTTHAVLLELGSAFSKLAFRPLAVKMIGAIQTSSRWQCVYVDAALMARGFQRFVRFADKEWGLVDCISMVVAEDLGISEIFTADRHFSQAGFHILLPSSF